MKTKENLTFRVMTIASLFVLIIIASSCSKRVERKLENTSWTGTEITVEYADSIATTDEFFNYLQFKDDGTFIRTYEQGVWDNEGEKLILTPYEGTFTRSYKITKFTNKELVLETRRSLSTPFSLDADGNENGPRVTETYERIK